MVVPPRDSSKERDDADRTVEKLFLTHSGAIKGFIHALLRDRNLVDDVLQETFLVISAKADTFRPGTNFMAWACTIARFKVLEAIRTHTRDQQFLPPDLIELLAAEAPSGDDHETLMKHLDSCIRQLTGSLRRVIDLRYLNEMPVDEVARSLQLTIDSTYVVLSRARSSLRLCVTKKLGNP
jgi:RNA polymerase sigma-70 factor (ECF subfamily)